METARRLFSPVWYSINTVESIHIHLILSMLQLNVVFFAVAREIKLIVVQYNKNT